MSVKINVGMAAVMLIATAALFGSVYGIVAGGFGYDVTILVAVAGISFLAFAVSFMNLKTKITSRAPILYPSSTPKKEEPSVRAEDLLKTNALGFDEEFAVVSGAASVETEAPDFDKYYETVKPTVQENIMTSREQYHAQISREMAAREAKQEVKADVLSENERRKKAFYAETENVESAPVAKSIITTGSDSRERGQSGNVSKAGEHSGKPGVPTIPYEPTDADYARLRGLMAGNAPNSPPGVRKGEDGFGATPSSAKAPGAGRPTEPTVFPSRAVSVAASDHRPAPHPSSLDYMDFTQVNTPTPFGTRFWDQFYEDDMTPPIMKVKFIPAKASLAFNRLRRIYLINLNRKPGVNLLGVNLRVKKSAPTVSASTRQGIEPASDKRLRERIEELRRGGASK